MASHLFSMDNPVFAAYAFYASLLILKMLFVVFSIIVKRLEKNAYLNPEDCAPWGSPLKEQKNSPDVDRIARIQRNDTENIPMFLIAGFLYVLSGPAAASAIWHFRIYTISRFLHNLFYFNKIVLFRGMCFGVGCATIISMAVQVLLATVV